MSRANDIILAGLCMTCYNGYMRCINYRALENFPIKNPPFCISTTMVTQYHYIVIQADAPKEDPWALLLP